MSRPATTLPQSREPHALRARGEEMYALMEELYPICRSITGPGLRRTLGILGERIPLQVHEVPTGTRVFDWTIPKEWSIRDAFIADAAGRRVVDFRESNLHVVNYSVPVDEQMPLEALRAHIHTLPEHPDWIPYRTSYYRETWGFCMRHADLERLPPGTYHARIDSTLAPGHLSYGELLVPGEDRREVLISTHVCHPSLCNDNLSGMVLATALARCLRDAHLRWSYRFVFIPGGIGSVAWLAANEDQTRNIHAGLVVTCVGDDGPFTYKQSRRGDAEIDRAAAQVLRDAGVEHSITPFSPYGYDERNYGSPGFNLPVGSLSRSSFGRFPQYHTSADDLSLVGPDSLAASLDMYLRVIQVLEGNRVFLSRQPKGEVQLGRRGLYGGMGGLQRRPSFELPLLWVLNLSDGEHSLLDVAERSGLPFEDIHAAAERLRQHELLQPLT